jgi:hypothetical protein
LQQNLDGPLPKLCPVILTSNQDGHQAKNREFKKKSSLKLLIEMPVKNQLLAVFNH